MRHPLLWALAVPVLFACLPADSPDPPDPAGPQAAPDAEPETSAAPPTPEALTERWNPYFEERLRSRIESLVVGELDGEPPVDAVLRLEGGTYYAVSDATTAEPTRMTVLDVGPQNAPLSLRDDHVLLGPEWGLQIRYDATAEAWVFSQDIPAALEEQAAAARKYHPKAFAPGPKWMFGDKGFNGEKDLEQHFVADFDADGKPELVVLQPRGITLYNAKGQPNFKKLDYSAERAMVHFGPSTLKLREPTEIDRDWLALIWPEAASQAWVYEGKGEWKRIQVGD